MSFVQVTKLRKTDVILMNSAFWTITFQRVSVESLPSTVCLGSPGVVNVIMLGDPAQLPAVGRSDLFGI